MSLYITLLLKWLQVAIAVWIVILVLALLSNHVAAINPMYNPQTFENGNANQFWVPYSVQLTPGDQQ